VALGPSASGRGRSARTSWRVRCDPGCSTSLRWIGACQLPLGRTRWRGREPSGRAVSSTRLFFVRTWSLGDSCSFGQPEQPHSAAQVLHLACRLAQRNHHDRRRALRRLWGALIRRIWEVDPLVGRRCGHAMRIIIYGSV